MSPVQASLLAIRLSLSAIFHQCFMIIFSSEEQAGEAWEPSNKAVLLLKLEALERKHFYVCHDVSKKDLIISGYEPHEGLNVKTG